MVSTTTTTTIAAGQPTSSSNHHPHQQQQAAAATLGSTATAAATANNSNYQRSASEQQQQQQHQHTQSYHHPSSSTSSSTTTHNSYYNSLALNGVGSNNNNNNSTSRSNSNVKNRVAAKTVSLSGLTTATGQASDADVGVDYHHSSHYSSRPSSLYNGSGNIAGDDQTSNSSSPSTTRTPAVEEETANVEEEQPQSHESTAVTKSPTTATTTVNLSQGLLSTSPPLLNDQISLLFPKCRPRQLSPNSNAATSRSDNIQSKSHSSCDSEALNATRALSKNEEYTPSTPVGSHKKRLNPKFERDVCDNESTENIRVETAAAATAPTPTPLPSVPVPVAATTTTNYYKSVNIITQSPPPPSTSSVSSESLSSVTPRISTNPFLSHTGSVERKPLERAARHQHRNSEEEKQALSTRRTRNDKGGGDLYNEHGICSDEIEVENINDNGIAEDEDEELPVPSYPPTFYYHTETKHSQSQARQRQHQTGDSSNSYEMPRKRASYGTHHHPIQQPYTHFTSSAAQQQQPQHQPVQLLQQHKQANHGANVTTGSFNQNPFIRDGNYWDTVRHNSTNEAAATAAHVTNDTEHATSPPSYDDIGDAESHNITTSVSTQSTTFGSTSTTTKPVDIAATKMTARRSHYQQQPYTNSVPPRQHHPPAAQRTQSQSQHISRLARAITEPDAAGGQYAEMGTKHGHNFKQQLMQQQQQQQQQSGLQAVQNSCAEGLTPIASHYLYGSKTSLDLQPQQQQHVISVSDNSILVEREIRERDREQREQRKAAAAYVGDWEREREREHERDRERGREREWQLECERENEREMQREREKEKERANGRERERDFEREQGRCIDVDAGEPQQYQPVKHRNSRKHSNVANTNGHSVANNGEVVVFDDIAESWQNLRVTTDTSAPTIPTAMTRHQLQQQQQQKHHRQPASLTLVDDDKDEYAEQVVNNHGDVEVTGSHNTSNNGTSIMYKDHPKRYLDRSGYTMHAVETRHGIIEYEGSPRRIGGQTSGVAPTADDDKQAEDAVAAAVADADAEEIAEDVDVGLSMQPNSVHVQQKRLTKTTAAATSSNNGAGGNSQHTTTTTTTTTHNSPQQQYPARPGFPQRIISPPRESTPPIMLLSHNNSKHQQQQLPDYQYQQQPQALQQRQSSPPTACTLDNNAEDTSNDVSEIGTISDLTTPEAISATGVPTTFTCATDSPALNVANSAAMPPPSTSAMAACKPVTTISSSAFSIPTKSSTFDYLYEFSETRKVLEEFFKCPSIDDRPIENGSDVDSIDIQYEFHSNLDRGDDDELDSHSNLNVDAEDEDDEEEEDDDDDDDGLMGVDMDDIHPQQNHHHHHQLQQQHNNQMRQLQTTLQQRNNPRDTQSHLQTSPTPTATYRLQAQQQQQQQQQQQEKQHIKYLQQQPLQQSQTQQEETQRTATTTTTTTTNQRARLHHRQQQQTTNNSNITSSNNSISNSNSNVYNNSVHAHRRRFTASPLMRDFDFFLDSASRSSGEQLDQQDGVNHNQLDTPSTYRYSPETTDYDSNCGDLDSLSGEINGVSTSCSNYTKYYASSMPVLEDGLSSGHTSDTENNNQNNLNSNMQQPSAATSHNLVGSGGISMLMDTKRLSTNNSINSMNNLTISTADGGVGGVGGEPRNNSISSNIIHDTMYLHRNDSPTPTAGLHEDSGRESVRSATKRDGRVGERELLGQSPTNNSNKKVFKNIDPELDSLYSISIFHRPDMVQMTPPPPAPAPHRKPNILSPEPEILQPTPYKDNLHSAPPPPSATSPISSALVPTVGINSNSGVTSVASAISSTLNRSKLHTQHQSGVGLSTAQRTNQSHAQSQPPPQPQSTQSLPATQTHSQLQPPPPPIPERSIPRTPSPVMNSPVWLPRNLDNSAIKSLLASSPGHHSKNLSADEDDVDTDLETDRLLGHQRLDDQGYYDDNKSWESRKPRASILSKISPKQQMASTKTRNGYNALLTTTPEIPPPIPPKNSTSKLLDIDGSISSSEHSDKSPIKSIDAQDCVVTMGSPGGSDGSACISGNSKKELDLSTINSNGLPNSGGSNSGSGSGNCSGGGSGGVGLVGTGNANGSVGGSGSGGSGNGNGVGGGGGGGGHSSSAGSNSTSGEKKVKKSKNKEGKCIGLSSRK
ncbi:PREDICTED: uncharacterized protein LOC108362185 [Rhagoletis zephyria]|uniref:uncharacterized protein LOC108362185 n=1 Tax=Rhagoletis zephyria TaxID=28612 RepID=UPI0008116F59|nr:PREDICTED: uncharacterized protein LOC108362185 [Rhagoletis zephyria]